MKPRESYPIANSTLRRHSELHDGKTPIRKVKIRTRNDARRSKVAKQRAKERRSVEEKIAREEGWVRAAGICECGCGESFGEHALDRPHWHHTSYRKHRGIWVRRRCHEVIELRDFPHRHQRGRVYG